jgi:competence ComEA-like helix-hairpin-helix protein
MADGVNEKIDINTAPVGELTQLPGIAVNMARAIVNHRQRHGFFSVVEELAEVKHFPVERLPEIRERVILTQLEGSPPPRHLRTTHLHEVQKKTSGFTKALRSTRGKDRSSELTGHRPRKVG